MFSERPYDLFSMDALAAEAGVSKGLLYHYFPTKKEFYKAALRQATTEMAGVIEADAALPVAAQLRTALDAYLEYVRGHAGAYRAVLRGGIGNDPEIALIADEFRELIFRRVLARLGSEPPPPLALAVRGWIGFVEAASLDWIETARLPKAEVVELLAALLEHLVAQTSDNR
jgi:AcrR family transcriptional regulator